MSRPAKSLEEHERQGTRSKTVPLPDAAILQGRPWIPSHLNREERAEWKRFCQLLTKRGVATEGDSALLAEAAVISCRWKLAKADLERRGLTIICTVFDKNGNECEREKQNPYLRIAETCERNLFAILQQLGLTPVRREQARPARDPNAKKPETLEEMIAVMPEKENENGDGDSE